MIRSWKSKEAEKIWHGVVSKKLPYDIQDVARRKLRMLHNACSLNDLRVPLGNHLESLKGRRMGQYSLRVNDQWRICFMWQGANADDVEIVDYH